jgi:hypothetical protein
MRVKRGRLETPPALGAGRFSEIHEDASMENTPMLGVFDSVSSCFLGGLCRESDNNSEFLVPPSANIAPRWE